MEQRARAPLADDKVCLDAGLAQPLKQSDAVDHAGGSRHSDYQLHLRVLSTECSVVNGPDPCSARRAACSSASTMTRATTAAAAIPGYGGLRRCCARSAPTSGSCRSSSPPAPSSTC